MTRLFIKPETKPKVSRAVYYQSELKRMLTREELSDDTRNGIGQLLGFYSANPDDYLFPKEAKILLNKAHAEIEKRLMDDLTD